MQGSEDGSVEVEDEQNSQDLYPTHLSRAHCIILTQNALKPETVKSVYNNPD